MFNHLGLGGRREGRRQQCPHSGVDQSTAHSMRLRLSRCLSLSLSCCETVWWRRSNESSTSPARGRHGQLQVLYRRQQPPRECARKTRQVVWHDQHCELGLGSCDVRLYVRLKNASSPLQENAVATVCLKRKTRAKRVESDPRRDSKMQALPEEGNAVSSVGLTRKTGAKRAKKSRVVPYRLSV